MIFTFNLLPLYLDANDVAIVKSLLNDGKKSFRQISQDTGIIIPSIKARFERLVNVGFIKGVFPIFDFGKVNDNNDGHQQHQQYQQYQQYQQGSLIQIQNIKENVAVNENAIENAHANVFEKEMGKHGKQNHRRTCNKHRM